MSLPSGRPRWGIFLGIAAAVVVLDQASKAWLESILAPGERLSVIGDLVRLTHAQNSGALFGLFRDQAYVFAIVSIGVVGLIIWYHRSSGRNTLLSRLFAPRADRVLFAATKADHVHHTSHDRLDRLLRFQVLEQFEALARHDEIEIFERVVRRGRAGRAGGAAPQHQSQRRSTRKRTRRNESPPRERRARLARLLDRGAARLREPRANVAVERIGAGPQQLLRAAFQRTRLVIFGAHDQNSPNRPRRLCTARK